MSPKQVICSHPTTINNAAKHCIFFALGTSELRARFNPSSQCIDLNGMHLECISNVANYLLDLSWHIYFILTNFFTYF
jgi:hypothetical protein